MLQMTYLVNVFNYLSYLSYTRNSHPAVFCEKGVLQACNFIEKETLAQLFSCEFCEISKNTFFYRTPLVAASVKRR